MNFTHLQVNFFTHLNFTLLDECRFLIQKCIIKLSNCAAFISIYEVCMRIHLICLFFIAFVMLNIVESKAGSVEQVKNNIANTSPAALPQGAVASPYTGPADHSTPSVNAIMPPASTTASQAPKTNPKQEAMNAYNQGKFARAHTLWLALAKGGDGESMNNLGMLYDGGKGVPLDSKEALMWFRKSAEAGYAGGMSNLGRMLEQGRGTTRHVDTAAAWFRKAADLGQSDAQYNLGVLYERGEGVIKNDKHAASWYSLAAANGQIEAQARLGHLYRVGNGVEKDKAKATLLLYGASMNGHAKAKAELFAMAEEQYRHKGLPRVNVFGSELSDPKGVKRASMRSALAVSKVKAIREDMAYICDVYDLQNNVPGASQMAACYGTMATSQAEQPLGFLKIDYVVHDKEQAKAIQKMVESRFGPPSSAEGEYGALWNLGRVIVATQYVPESKEVGLMYMLPSVYHMTQPAVGN